MLSPYHLPHLIRYFDGIDLALSKRLQRRPPPSEPTLTEEFCALMSTANQRNEKMLAFDVDALSAALTAYGDAIGFEFRIDTHQHPLWMEAYVSQSDFALVLECKNTVLPQYSWYSAYLVQAKRLFPNAIDEYGLNSTFASVDKHQQQRMQNLVRILGDRALKYCLYCPPTSGYTDSAKAGIRALHTFNLSTHIFDFAIGLALHDAIRQSGGVESGIWILGATPEPSNASDLHREAFLSAHPLTWFLLNHFGEPGIFHGMHRLPCLQNASRGYEWKASVNTPSPEIERVRAIASGDSEAIRQLINELGDDARKADLDPETRKILPATTMTISLRVGPLGGVDLPL